MAFADENDVKVAMGRDLTAEEQGRAAGLLDEASDIADAYLHWGGEAPTPIPDPVRRVVARMVARVLKQDSDTTGAVVGAEQVSRTMGPFTEQATFVSGANTGAPWLSVTDKTILRPLRTGGGLTAATFSTPQTGRYRTEA